MFWGMLELGVAVTVACLPTIRLASRIKTATKALQDLQGLFQRLLNSSLDYLFYRKQTVRRSESASTIMLPRYLVAEATSGVELDQACSRESERKDAIIPPDKIHVSYQYSVRHVS